MKCKWLFILPVLSCLAFGPGGFTMGRKPWRYSVITSPIVNLSYALSFDGTNDYVALGALAWPMTRTNCSMSIWIKPRAGSGSIYSESDNYGNIVGRLMVENFLVRYDNNAATVVRTINTIPSNEWTHVVFGCNSVGRFIYTNGVLACQSNDVTEFGPVGHTAANSFFGTREAGGVKGLWYNGIIDEPTIWTQRCLSAYEAYGLHADKFGLYGLTNTSPWEFNLKMLMHLDEGSGNSCIDSSINAYTGSLSGPSWTTGKIQIRPSLWGNYTNSILEYYSSLWEADDPRFADYSIDGTRLGFVNFGTATTPSLTFVSNTTWCYEFRSALNQNITITNAYNSLAFSTSSPFTVSFWYKSLSTWAANKCLIAYMDTNYKGWTIYSSDVNTPFRFALIYNNTTHESLDVSPSGGAAKVADWNHFVCVYEGGTNPGCIKMYTNGYNSALLTNYWSLVHDFKTNLNVGKIGIFATGISPLDGWVANLMIATSAWNAAYVTNVFETTKPYMYAEPLPSTETYAPPIGSMYNWYFERTNLIDGAILGWSSYATNCNLFLRLGGSECPVREIVTNNPQTTYCYSFDGGDAPYGDYSFKEQFETNKSFTFCCWKRGGPLWDGSKLLASCALNSSPYSGWTLTDARVNNGYYRFLICDQSAVVHPIGFDFTNTASASDWVCVVVTKQAGVRSSDMNVWVNGALVTNRFSEYTNSLISSTIGANALMYLGARGTYSSYGQQTTVRMAFPRVYNRVITGSEITNYYQTFNPTNFLGQYPQQLPSSSLYFPTGVNAYVEFTNVYASVPSYFTWSMWIKPVYTGSWCSLFGYTHAVSAVPFCLLLLSYPSTNNLFLQACSDDNTLHQVTVNCDNLFDGEWHHIALSRSNATWNMWCDGIVILTNRSVNLLYTSINRTLLGAYNYGSSPVNRFYKGSIDELNIWTTNIAPAYITNMYNQGKAYYGSISQLPWSTLFNFGCHFDEQSGTKLNDFGGNNRTGTINSAVWTNNGAVPLF
jgi:hypothetical protein